MSPEIPLGERLERLVSLHEAAQRRAGDPDWKVGLYAPATEAQLDRIDAHLGRLLPEEARELYLWHNGCGYTAFVPGVDFQKLEVAYQWWLPTRQLATPFEVTNRQGAIEVRVLFPVFNINKLSLDVMTSVERRAKSSPLYLLDLEMTRLTLQAHSIRNFIEHLIGLFEHGYVESTEHGLRWTREPYSFDPSMTPYGDQPDG